MENRERQLRKSRDYTLFKNGANFILKSGFGFLRGSGTRIKGKLELVEKIGQFR
jgi:hypothetical protein